MAKNKINWNNMALIFIAVVLIVVIFTFFDYLIHSLSNKFSVPEYYFRNKVIWGIVWGLAIYFIILKKKFENRIWLKSLIFSALIAIILQARYFYEGYSLDFVIEFLFIHFGILWIVSYLGFKILNRNKIN